QRFPTVGKLPSIRFRTSERFPFRDLAQITGTSEFRGVDRPRQGRPHARFRKKRRGGEFSHFGTPASGGVAAIRPFPLPWTTWFCGGSRLVRGRPPDRGEACWPLRA